MSRWNDKWKPILALAPGVSPLAGPVARAGAAPSAQR
jgi:hypothetical protein